MPGTETIAITIRVLALRSYKLTDKDLALIRQLCLPYKIISQDAGVSDIVTKKRVGRLAAKLKVENRAAIIVKALKLDLVTIDELTYREFDNGENTLRKNS